MTIFRIALFLIFLIPTVSLAEVNIYQKAEQMIILGFSGSSTANTDADEILKEMNVGGLIFFDYDSGTKKYKRNFSNSKDLFNLYKMIFRTAETMPWVAIDEEGGMVSRLKSFATYGKTGYAKDMATLSNTKIKDIFSWRAKNIANYGFSMNFAPVVDLCYKNAVMEKQKRCFSSNPEKAFGLANLFAQELKRKSTMPVFKHYPGIGSGAADTHLKPVDITSTYNQNDLKPFDLLCKDDNENAVMLSHVVNTKIDTLPASMSLVHVENLKKLGCTNGLIITDDMDMKAITVNYELKEVLKHSINAGADMIIFSNNISSYNANKYKDIQKALHELIDSGEVSKEKISAAYDRIIYQKKIYSLVD